MSYFLLIWSLSALGFLALASSMQKHQKQLFSTELSSKHSQLAKISGWLLLILSLALCFIAYPTSNAISYWIAVLSFAGVATILWLSYATFKTQHYAMALGGLSVISALLSFI